MTERVYLHIGPPKTGTSYLQQALWAGKETLATAGVLVPGDTQAAHRLATWDFFGRRPEGADMPAVKGSWQGLVDRVRDWDGSTAVISEESLSVARGRQVRRLARAFVPAELHVVITARDLGRIIPAAWQQRVQGGETQPWTEFVADLRDPGGASPPALLFWLRQDLVQVLAAWSSVVPVERIAVVTVPPAGSPPRLLLERFARATGLDPAALQAEAAATNPALGAAETEVLRRLNAGLGGRLNERQYRRAVRVGVVPALRERPGQTRIALPAGDRGWVDERSHAVVDALEAGGYPVCGDPHDLLGDPDRQEAEPAALSDTALADALVIALTGVTEDLARSWWRHRSADRPAATVGGGLSSRAGGAVFRLKSAALRAARHNRLLAGAARRYLRRSGAPT